MKKIAFVLMSCILFACNSKHDQLLKQIKEKEKIVQKSYEDIPDKSTSESLRQDYMSFANKFPADSLSPMFLHKASELCIAMDMPNEAVITIDTLIERYPKYQFLPDAVFFKGFVLENYIKDLPAAQKVYEDFISKWENHPLSSQVSAAINNIGKSAEELVNEFMKRTQQVDTAFIDEKNKK